MKKMLFIALAALVCVGCASVPMADAGLDAEAKKFTPPADKAGIYVFRNTSFGGGVKMPVFVDGNQIGVTAGKTFLYKEVEPGYHVIVSKAENTETLELEAEKGKLYFIWQQVRMGVWKARNTLHLVMESEGKKGVLETKLAVTK